MKRFYHGSSHHWHKILSSVFLFLGCFGLLFSGLSGVSNESSEKQTELLNRAITRGIVHCYASQGHYPENLDYLKTHYGVSYDKDKYFVDYQVLGENIFPDVSIILLEP